MGTETNVETQFLETQPIELYGGLMKLNEMIQTKKDTLYQSEPQVVENKIAMDAITDFYSEEYVNIPKTNDEQKSLKINMNEKIESFLQFKEWHQKKRKEIVSKIEKQKGNVKQSC